MSSLTWWRRAWPPDERRWIVVDVEASGPDVRRHQLLAVAALALRLDGPERPRIDLGDSFEVVLRPHALTLDKPNILLHGIGLGAQRAGVAPALGLAAFTRWVGHSPLIAYHAGFDRTLIRRALRQAALPRLPNPWLDLATVADVALPQLRARALDDWLQHFGIEVAQRHQAAADSLATAELLLRLWPALRVQQPSPGFHGLAELAAARRWLRPG